MAATAIRHRLAPFSHRLRTVAETLSYRKLDEAGFDRSCGHCSEPHAVCAGTFALANAARANTSGDPMALHRASKPDRTPCQRSSSMRSNTSTSSCNVASLRKSRASSHEPKSDSASRHALPIRDLTPARNDVYTKLLTRPSAKRLSIIQWFPALLDSPQFGPAGRQAYDFLGVLGHVY
jgi:hypothetical protein